MKIFSLIASLLAIGLIAATADADIYTWQDQEGILHFSNIRPLHNENVTIFLRETGADPAEEDTGPRNGWQPSGKEPTPEPAGDGDISASEADGRMDPVDTIETFAAAAPVPEEKRVPAATADPDANGSGDDDGVSQNDRHGLYYYLEYKHRHHPRHPLYKRHDRHRRHYGNAGNTKRRPGKDGITRQWEGKQRRIYKHKNLTRQLKEKRHRTGKPEKLTRRHSGHGQQVENRRLKYKQSIRKKPSRPPFSRRHAPTRSGPPKI